MKQMILFIALLAFGCAAPNEDVAEVTHALESSSSVSMTQVVATATVFPLQPPTTVVCPGDDGETYLYIEIFGEGTITSSDPRLSGVFFAHARLLHRASDGSGVSTDNFEVRDSETGVLKMKGTAWATDPPPPAPIKGFAKAKLSDGSRFWAHSTVTLPVPGTADPIIIEYGTASPGVQDRAEIFTGAKSCMALMN